MGKKILTMAPTFHHLQRVCHRWRSLMILKMMFHTYFDWTSSGHVLRSPKKSRKNILNKIFYFIKCVVYKHLDTVVYLRTLYGNYLYMQVCLSVNKNPECMEAPHTGLATSRDYINNFGKGFCVFHDLPRRLFKKTVVVFNIPRRFYYKTVVVYNIPRRFYFNRPSWSISVSLNLPRRFNTRTVVVL